MDPNGKGRYFALTNIRLRTKAKVVDNYKNIREKLFEKIKYKRVNKSEVTRTPTFNFGDCYTSQLILHSLLVNTSLPFTFFNN
jgi:hypothetical protein